MIWSRTVHACDFRCTMLIGLASFGSFADSSQISMSRSGMYHFSSNSNPFRSPARPTALYLAHAITSLNSSRWRSFRCPSASSTMNDWTLVWLLLWLRGWDGISSVLAFSTVEMSSRLEVEPVPTPPG
uniref:Uncharacterized protein n=1 Tax=Anopheles coluzzii TaxID=1518534 RepID=A0A8W7PSQ7_ANOCL